jgi:hypothetical protein
MLEPQASVQINPREGIKKPRNSEASRDGGYGWTRTTDPSIMSAVL